MPYVYKTNKAVMGLLAASPPLGPGNSLTTTIKYQITGNADVRTRPVFDYEFVQTIHVVLQ